MTLQAATHLPITTAMKSYSLLRFLKVFAAAWFLAVTTGAVMAAPEIAVEQPVGTNIPENNAVRVSFGTVDLGANPSGFNDLTFRIKNTGATPPDLILGGIPKVTVTGDASFTVTVQPPLTNVTGPSGFTDFTVRFAPSSPGIKDATLTIPNTDADENPFRINVRGTATAPEIAVDDALAVNIPDNGPQQDFGTLDIGANPGATVSKTFTIKNTGSSNLTIGTLSGLSGTEFSVTAAPGSPVSGPAGTTTFTVTFAPTSRGVKTATLHIANNDLDEDPFDLNLKGTALAPEIAVEQSGTNINDGDTYSFGSVTAGSSATRTFTIKNTGDSNLTGLAITVDGNQPNEFKVPVRPIAPVGGPAGTTTFVVEFNPSVTGPRSAVLHIASNDPDEQSFDITLAGTGAAPLAGTDSFGYRYTTTPTNAIKLDEADFGVYSASNLTGDDTAQAVSLGFNFFFYDKVYTTCNVSTNGLISFNSEALTSFSPHTFPSGTAPNNCIAPFWSDLYKESYSKILYTTRGEVGDRYFIVDYQDMAQYNNDAGDEKISFQVILYERSNSIEFQFKSKSDNFDMSRTIEIGIENSLGAVGISYPGRTFGSTDGTQPGSAIVFTRPVFYTVESNYPPPGSPPPMALTNCTTTDGSATVTHSALDGTAPVGWRIIGTNIPPGATVASSTPGQFVLSAPATGSGVAQSLTASNAVDVGALVLNPRIGRSRSAYGTVQRFEAPEFIYLNQSFQELSEVGDVNAPDAFKAWYRLVNDGYALDGQIVQGTQLFFTTTLDHDVTVVWRWRLEYAVVIDSATGQGGFGNPDPEVGRTWRPLGNQFSASIDSTVEDAGAGFRFRTIGYTVYNKAGVEISPGINPNTNLAHPVGPYLFPNDLADRRSTLPVSITEPIRVMWNFVGQVRYRFDAAIAGQAGPTFDGQSFVRVYNADRVTPDTSFGPGGVVYATGPNMEVWVDSGAAGRKVDVGAFYRSTDAAVTLGGFAAPPGGDLTGVNSVNALNDDTTVLDQQGATRVSRIFTVRNANNPTEIHWLYQSAIYRAEVPLGKSLNALDPNPQLSPALPAGAVLRVADTGPGTAFTTKIYPPDGSYTLGDPLRWDGLGKALFPVRSGAYEVAWPDANDGRTYRVEILTGYPGDTVVRTFASEAADGSRLRNGVVSLSSCATTDGSTTVTCASTAGLLAGMNIRGANIATGATVASVNANGTTFVLSAAATGTQTGLTLSGWTSYQNTVTLPDIDVAAGFPAQPEKAHYHHLFDSVGRQAPTKLDLDPADEWKFQDMTFADASAGATVSKTTTGVPFNTTGPGRSVLLYSFRPNPTEVADGDLTQENLAVRIVRSSPVNVIGRDNSKLVLGRKGLQLGGGASSSGGAFGIVGAGNVSPGNQFLVDFWLNAKGLESSGAVTLTNCTTNGTITVTCASTAGLAPGMSISGPTIPAGTKIVSLGTNKTSLTLSTAATGSGMGLTLSASYSSVTLTNCTTNSTATVTCNSTADLVAGMSITGPNIVPGTRIASIANATTLVLSAAATASDAGLTLTAANKPVTVLTSGGGGLKVTLDASASTVTATYRGIAVTHGLSKAGAGWRHLVIHAFQKEVFGTNATVVDFYLDGVRQEQALPTDFLQAAASADSTAGPTLGANSFRFGVDVDPLSGLQLDQFRLFTFQDFATDKTGYLTPGEVRQLKTVRDMTVVGSRLRNTAPQLWFSFEAAAANGSFANQGTLGGVGVGPVAGASPFAGTWADVDIQEVATRIDSTLDNAGFGGSGFIRNEVSNYNSDLYLRNAEVGTWGPIFPVNDKQLFADPLKRLEVVYYENPWLIDPMPHPNVAWPYVVTEFNDVGFPAVGPHKDKAIYIASRIGSEGVDKKGRPQKVFDLARYSDLKIYHQPSAAAAGYNPNEEHALTAPSGRAALKVKNLGETLANNPPLAAFALQKDANNKPAGTFTSSPWVLVQVTNLDSGEAEMAAYQVFDVRGGSVPFPRPLDSQVGGTTGLAYEAAATPEARFLTLAAGTDFDFGYQFQYPVFAGDLLVPPYPVNIVIGNLSMADERGGNIQFKNAAGQDVLQRTLWRDAAKHAWVVSGGGGQFFEQFFYPMRADFYLPGAGVGDPVAWLPVSPASHAAFLGNDQPGSPSLDDEPRPVKVRYTSAWRSDYPKLKRGETLTYQGGEYFNETPGSNGLPAVVAMKAAEIVFDSATPNMVISSTDSTALIAELDNASARVIRPLDRREVPFTIAEMDAAGLKPGDPASSKVIVVAERWYFKDLTGSLQKRFYFNSLEQRLVFRGRLNDKEGGDPDLTSGPDPINSLEPNVMTVSDFADDIAIQLPTLTAKAGDIYTLAQNPNGVTSLPISVVAPLFLQGVKQVPASPTAAQQAMIDEQKTFWKSDLSGTVNSPNPVLLQLDSFGVGSALVPNPNLLTRTPTGSLYITLAENSRAELDGAPVSLHVIEIIPDRYRGAIKVIEGSDAFSEKITLQHNGEFGANTGNLDYEWWVRDSRELDETLKDEIASLATNQPDPNWQLYKAGNGLHTIVFEGRPDVVLADKLVLMRYRHKNETKGWKLVPFELPTGTTAAVAWKPGSSTVEAPFQWAGAANSPQLQADGSKRYIPQLVMGWVKRILDRINPYEARYTDFFSNESAASYTSMIQIAGGPYAGNVALNPDKNVIENTGLIELYRTVLERARSLSIDNSSNGNSTDGINQALLLAATRLSVLYELLAREAYSDAQDSIISVNDDDPSGLASVATYTHAFQNLEPDLLHEELSLLRGTDFRKSYPVYNRIFWNYAKGLGEAAYNSNYNIYDVNTDGFINEDDARRLYPQGHGDAWGHGLSALQMHYVLLQHPNFSWKARSELYSLMQNVLPVDYLDEKTFARLAAGRARTGRDIVRATYRLKYTQDPDGQWQGYTDSADKARAWGVSEWAHRAGQGAYFDWAVANAMLPEQAVGSTGQPQQNLARIERSGAEDEIAGVAAGLHEIQTAMDESNQGFNPLGFSSDAIAFDIDPTLLYVGSTAQVGTRAVQGLTHFEQIYERAVLSGRNAVEVLRVATQANAKLRVIANDTESLIVDSIRQDLDYRNRLIEIFGRPYSGQIGFGKTYPEGYEGPDTMLYAYLDKITIDKIVPGNTDTASNVVTFTTVYNTVKGLADNATMVDLYKSVWGDTTGAQKIKNSFETIVGDNLYQFEPADPDGTGPLTAPSLTFPYNTASKFGFEAPTGWGQRTSYGKVQTALEEMLSAEITLDQAIADYLGFLQDWEQKLHNLQSELELFAKKKGNNEQIDRIRKGVNGAIVAADGLIAAAQAIRDFAKPTAQSIKESLPLVAGLAFDVTSVARGVAYAAGEAASGVFNAIKNAKDIAKSIAEIARDESIADIGRTQEYIDVISSIQGLVAELEYHSGGDQPKRDTIGAAIHEMELKRQEYFTALSDGFRLQREREAFNKILAAKTQKNRYQDMIMRLSRNEVMAKYQSAFNLAARYAWLAAKAYDYETSLDPGDPAAATQLFDLIIKERQLGQWQDGSGLGEPKAGKGGLAELLATLRGNFDALEGQIGLNHIQVAYEGMSMRGEYFRIGAPLDPAIQAILDLPPGTQLTDEEARLMALPETQQAIADAPASDARWKDVLKGTAVDDLWQVPEFRQHCRPFADPSAGKQPGLVFRFSTAIEPGLNVFGRALIGGDHAYSSSQFATRIAVAGVVLKGYPHTDLAFTPRAYLIPVGTDYCRVSTATNPITRSWSVKDARIPTPYVINQSQLGAPGFIPRLDGIDGTFGDVRRHADFRMFHEGDGDHAAEDDNNSTRLMARSVWNSKWLLIIPGAGLYYDSKQGLERFTENVSDITLNFKTYSHNGQ